MSCDITSLDFNVGVLNNRELHWFNVEKEQAFPKALSSVPDCYLRREWGPEIRAADVCQDWALQLSSP